MTITYGKSIHGKEEINAVLEVLKTSTQMGKKVRNFENKISTLFNKKNGIMVNSGSSALFLAFKVLNLPENSNVITPVFTFGTTVGAIIQNNLIPNFVDINYNTYCIDVDAIENSIDSNTSAICVPNLIGNLPNWEIIREIANKHNLHVIEDSADTLGAKFNSKSTGFYSDISITSFYGSHIISCAGNGGMFLTNNRDYYKKANVLRSWGRMSSIIKNSENINERLGIKLKGIEYDRKFVFSEIGYNFEPSEISASFGLIQLKKFKGFNKIRNRNFNLHFNFFTNYKEFFIQPKIKKNISTNFLAYPLILKENNIFSRKQLQIYLEKNKIQTRPIFSGNILRHPAFENLNFAQNKRGSFKSSDYIMRNGLLIGCHQGLTERHMNYIHKIVNIFIKKKRKK